MDTCNGITCPNYLELIIVDLMIISIVILTSYDDIIYVLFHIHVASWWRQMRGNKFGSQHSKSQLQICSSLFLLSSGIHRPQIVAVDQEHFAQSEEVNHLQKKTSKVIGDGDPIVFEKLKKYFNLYVLSQIQVKIRTFCTKQHNHNGYPIIFGKLKKWCLEPKYNLRIKNVLHKSTWKHIMKETRGYQRKY